MSASAYVPYQKIVDHLPIESGDTLLVGSRILDLAVAATENGEKLDLNRFIDSLQKKLGTQGTLLFPTYNFDFCSKKPYDVKKSPAETGALPKAALARPDFKRTRHPLHSFAVWGRHQESLCAMENKSSFDIHSPFHFLHENKGRMLIIGIGVQGAFTFAHYVEEREKAPYRYFKDFTALYTGPDGKSGERTYSMFVRAMERGVESYLEPLEKKFEDDGVMKRWDINGVAFRMIDLKKAAKTIALDIRENGGKSLYRINA